MRHTFYVSREGADDSPDCPICKKEDSFKENVINYQLEGVLKSIRDELTPQNFLNVSNELESMDQGQCSECSSHCRLRICVTCVKKLKILSRSVNNSWKLNPVENSYEKAFLNAKFRSICSSCVLDKHDGHTVVPFRSLGNLKYKSSYVQANGALLEQKIDMEDAYGEWQGVVTHFKRILVKEQVRDNWKDEEDTDFKISVPELRKKQAESKEKRKAALEKYKNLFQMMTEFERSHLKEYIRCGIQVNDGGSVPVEVLQKILEEFPEMEKEKRILIDKEIESRMITLESALINKTLLPYDGDQKYFKFKAIRIAYLEALDAKKATGIAQHKAELELQNLKIKLLPRLNQNLEKQEELCKETNPTPLRIRERLQIHTAILFYAREIIEKQLEVDQSYIEHVRANEKKIWADLMIKKFFPKLPTRSGEDQVYIELMSEFFDGIPDSDDKDMLL